MARHGAQSRSSSSRRGTRSTSSRRVSASSEASEEERQVVQLPAPPSPRCVKRRDFKAQGRARSRAKNLRRMESEEGGGGGGLGADLVQTSNGGGGQVEVIEAGGGEEQEVCPEESKKAADNPVEVTEPPFIMVEAYTVGGLASESPGREEDLSPTTSSHTQVVEVEESNSAMEEEASVVMRKNEHNEFLSNRGSEGNITKPDSLDLEQEHEHTSGFWTHRSSVISVTDSARGSSVLEVGSPTESVRDFLMQKRSSLTHTPDVVRVLQKLEAQHAGATDVHEFQKVKNELKHVDEDGATYLQLERISQLASFSNINSSETFESEQETVTEVDTSSRNVVVNMMPAPIKPFSGAPENESGAVEEKKVEPKANAQPKAPAGTGGRKKQSSTTTASGPSTKGVASKKISGAAQQPPKAAKSGEGTLQSPNLIQLLKPAAQNGTDKPTSSLGDGSLESPNLLKEVNGVPRRMSSKVAAAKKNPEKRLSSPAQMQGPVAGVGTRRHVPRPTPPSQQERRSKSPDKIPSSLPPLSHLNNASSEGHNKSRKQSNASVTSVKSTHSDQEQRRASFKPTESNVKGGFLAPTKAWLSLRGENVSLNSRSPSPGSKLSIDLSKERSMSPKRKLRESSAESDSQSRKSVSFGLKERRAIGKDPALPTVRRSSSLRGSTEAGKRTRVLKKASMENLTTQNGVNEPSKAKKETSLSRTSKERVSVRQTSRSKESLNRNREAKPGGPSRDVSKENTKLSAVKRSSSLRRDSSKETTKKEAATNNGLSENEAKGSNLRKRNASKENGGSKTSSNGAALANGVGTSGHRSNGTATESIPPKESTSIENGHLESVDKSAKVTKNSSAKSESQRKEASSIKNETNKTKNATTETATKSEVTETAKTTISSSTVSAASRTSTERRSSESKATSKSSLASMSQMKMMERGKSSSSSETTLLVGETSSQTETSTSSSKAVKEICETGRKTSSSNRVKTSTNNAIVASSTTSCVRAEGSTPRADLLRTTMVVRFRPGQPNQQAAWLADVQTGGSNTSSICGLEISFSSVPQDIDIKVIPSNSEEPGGAPPREAGSDKTS